MEKFFFRINKTFLLDFQNKVLGRFRSTFLRSDMSFIKAIFEELDSLFRKIQGRVSSRRDIPRPEDYPDSNKMNEIVEDMALDLEKIFTAQTIINDDVRNVMNYNSIEREKTFNSFVTIQQKVLTVYAASKRDELGFTEIPAEGQSPFQSSDALNDQSVDVSIDKVRKVLTLAKDSPDEENIVKPIDFDNVHCYFFDVLPRGIYPNNVNMAVGSHWKQEEGTPSVHFIDFKDSSAVSRYREMMIDNQDDNHGVGTCEFEAVHTRLDRPVLDDPTLDEIIAEEVGTDSQVQKDQELIYVDLPNSLQSQYMSRDNVRPDGWKKFKLVIPFKPNEAPLTNEIRIAFSQIDLPPNILWNESKVYSATAGQDVGFSFLPSPNSVDGKYNCLITKHLVPSRLELILEYSNSPWEELPFTMSWYKYTAGQRFQLPTSAAQTITLNIVKEYNVFVDSEADTGGSERNRAWQVLKNLTNNQGVQ